MRASHPDHMASGEATMRAVYPDARNPHAFPELLREGLTPHTVPVVWLSGSNATMVVDITKRFKYKHAALKRHVSQVGDNKGLKKMLKQWGRNVAQNAGMDKGRLAEGFKVVITS
jgi:LmbE family N-acetylglucosaminyl deacetylase